MINLTFSAHPPTPVRSEAYQDREHDRISHPHPTRWRVFAFPGDIVNDFIIELVDRAAAFHIVMASHPYAKTGPACLTRRRFLTVGLGISAAFVSPVGALASHRTEPAKRKLRLFNPRSKELLETTYWADGAYLPTALVEIDHLMRDMRSGKTTPMARGLLDLLHSVQTKLELRAPFHVISAFRTRSSNECLRKQGWAASKNSYHITGKAVDIRHPEMATAGLRKAAFELKQGGVGYYPRLNFVHLDIGPVRYWRRE